MKKPPLAGPKCVARSLALAGLLLSLLACSTSQVLRNGTMVAAPFANAALSHGTDGAGGLIAYLSDGRKLEGRWNPVTEQTRTDAVDIKTPRGRFTAEELAAPDRPAFTGTILTPPRVQMICAFVGDPESGYLCHCVDSAGVEWAGTFIDRGWLAKSYYRNVVVSLRQITRFPPGDTEAESREAGQERRQ